jgi:hypothetical protein
LKILRKHGLNQEEGTSQSGIIQMAYAGFLFIKEFLHRIISDINENFEINE